MFLYKQIIMPFPKKLKKLKENILMIQHYHCKKEMSMIILI